MTRLKTVQGLVRSAKDYNVARFFKTGKGSYSEHDKFLGASMPTLRRLAKEHEDIDRKDLLGLLHSEYNDERALALIMMVNKFQSDSSVENRKSVFDLYMANLAHVNNWNLVDMSSYQIVGEYLRESGDSELQLLHRLAQSPVLWERRVSMVSTFAFIRGKPHQLAPTFTLARRFLGDPEDLMHKATGWMLREAGKRDVAQLRAFLDEHAHEMPSVMLSYACEKLPDGVRKRYRTVRQEAAKARKEAEQQSQSE